MPASSSAPGAKAKLGKGRGGKKAPPNVSSLGGKQLSPSAVSNGVREGSSRAHWSRRMGTGEGLGPGACLYCPYFSFGSFSSFCSFDGVPPPAPLPSEQLLPGLYSCSAFILQGGQIQESLAEAAVAARGRLEASRLRETGRSL